MDLSPETQYELYLAVRDGDIAKVIEIMRWNASEPYTSIGLNVNSRPFETLWHPPGSDSTILHLACCCLQYDLVLFLLKSGANPFLKANNLIQLTCLRNLIYLKEDV